MNNKTIRLVFSLAILSAIGIIATQLFGLRKAYKLEEQEFYLKINVSLQNAANKIWELKKIQPTQLDIVEQISPDYFIVNINNKVSPDLIEHFITQEFTMRNIVTDFEFGIYDCSSNKVESKRYVHMSGSSEPFEPTINFPNVVRENYFFGVFFPHRKHYIKDQLNLWTFSSFVLLFVLIFLAYVVFIILKQKRLSEIQKDFVNNMTHEFKTPLATIQLAAEVLKKPNIVNNPDRLLRYATIIDSEAAQLVLNVERVLHMAQAEKGEIQLKKTKFNLQEVILELYRNFETIVDKYGASIQLNLPQETITFYGDRLHIKNALSNLIDNAIKYCDKIPHVEISLTENNHKIKIEIKDNGIGVSKPQQKLLFKSFYRVSTGNIHDVKGFGLGLNYVQIIVRAHNGDIICTSQKGKGSTFTIIFNNK